MTLDQVRRAVHSAASEAFRLGQEQSSRRGGSQLLDAARQYADQLVMPSVELAMDQAVEEAMTAQLQLATDPEPEGEHA